MPTDITRDDLRVNARNVGAGVVLAERKVTDEEFDRLAREAGFVKADDSILTTLSGCELAGLTRIRAEALRALLTDECEPCGGDGYTVEPSATGIGSFEQKCADCGGRGWLPKDGVELQWQCVKLDLMWLDGDRTAGARNGLPEHCREDHPSWNCGWMLSVSLDWLEAEDA